MSTSAPTSSTAERSGTTASSVARVLRASMTTAVASMTVQLLLTPFVLHRVGLSTFGTFSVLSAWLAFAALVDFGVRAEMTRRVALARGRGDWPQLFQVLAEGSSLLVAAGLGLLLLGVVTSPFLVHLALPGTTSSVEDPVLLLIALLSMIAVGVALDGWLAALDGLQRGDVREKGLLLGLGVRVVATVGLLQVNQSAWMLFYAALMSTVATWVFLLVRLRAIAPGITFALRRPRLSVARSFLSVSVLLVISQISDVVDFNVDRVIISHYLGPEASAQYSLGIQLPIALRALVLIPLGVLLPAVAEMKDTRPDALARLFTVLSRLTIGAAAVTVAGIVALAPLFYDLYLGQGLDLAARSAQLLALATLLNIFGAAWSLYAAGSAWYGVVATAAAANVVVNFVLSLLLTQQLGFMGALYGSLVGSTVGLLVCYAGVRRRERRPWLRPLLPVMGFSAVLIGGAFLAVTLLEPTGLTGLIVGAGTIAAAGVLCLWALGIVDRGALARLRARA